MHYPLWLVVITYLQWYPLWNNKFLWKAGYKAEAASTTHNCLWPNKWQICPGRSSAATATVLLLETCWHNWSTTTGENEESHPCRLVYTEYRYNIILCSFCWSGFGCTVRGRSILFSDCPFFFFLSWACYYALIHRFFEHTETFGDFFMAIDRYSRGSIWLSTAEHSKFLW